MIDLIEEAAIPMAVIGLLFALPNTQLTRRLAREGRLHANSEILPKGTGDQMATGSNFETIVRGGERTCRLNRDVECRLHGSTIDRGDKAVGSASMGRADSRAV
jgi:hypothetical protein